MKIPNWKDGQKADMVDNLSCKFENEYEFMLKNAIRNNDPRKLVIERIENLTYLLDVGTLRKRR